MKIAIIGAGVTGLAAAITLQENGFSDITLIADKFTPSTNSDVAAAFWYPYHVGPENKVPAWCNFSLQRYKTLINEAQSGVYWFDLADAYESDPGAPPAWHQFVTTKPLPEKFQSFGYHGVVLTIPMIDMSWYMPFLMAEIKKHRTTLISQKVTDLKQLDNFDLIINCSGLGSNKLCHDETLQPGRGQICLIEKPKHLENFGYVLQFDDGSFSHMNPRKDYIVAGGTNIETWDKEINEQANQNILSKVYTLFPELEKMKVIEKCVGFRPCRPEVRLEEEKLSNGQTVIHNYGHGGAGVTLSWGCAHEILKMI